MTRSQQPSNRMLLVIALIAAGGLSLSWLANRQAAEVAQGLPRAAPALFPQGPHGPAGAAVAIASRDAVHRLRGR